MNFILLADSVIFTDGNEGADDTKGTIDRPRNMDLAKFDFRNTTRHSASSTHGRRPFTGIFCVTNDGPLPLYALRGEHPRWIEWGTTDPSAWAVPAGHTIRIDGDMMIKGPLTVGQVVLEVILRHWAGDPMRPQVGSCFEKERWVP